MSHTYLCLPSYGWYSFTDPGGMESNIQLFYSLDVPTVAQRTVSEHLKDWQR